MAVAPPTLGRSPSRASEFAVGWPIVLGANLGIAIGVAAIPAHAIAVFMRSLNNEFGWTRAQISLGPTILIGVLAFASPALGWFTDRLRTTWICVTGLLALAAMLFAFSRLGSNLGLYYLACAAMGLLASGAGTVPYARAIAGSFTRSRGLALGIAMVGTGLSAILVPMFLSPYAARVGWRQGYVALAIIVMVATPLVGILMSRAPVPRSKTAEHAYLAGASFGLALRDPVFWTLGACFFLIPLGVGGLGLHLLSFLADSGVSPAKAGLTVSFLGAVQIVSRVTSGSLVDRFFAPTVAAATMTTSALCLVGLAVMGAPAAWLGPVAIGLALGAEIDLVGYMTARYFGMRSYGRVYGFLYAGSLLGSALSLIFYGAMYDATKSYTGAMIAGAGMLLLSVVLFATLRRFDSNAAGSESS